MPKLKSDTIDKNTILQYLVDNDDFAFEVRCLRELRKRQLKVSHAGTYSDPVTNKNRQFDFRLELDHDLFRIAIALECKNLKPNFPLLISRLPRLEQEAFHQLLIPSVDEPEASDFFGSLRTSPRKILFPSETVFLQAPHCPYAEGEMVGKSTVQIGRHVSGELYGDDSEVYEKWAQAVSSAYGLIEDAAHSFSESHEEIMAYFILPVVVVPDHMLWVMDYSTAGDILGEPKTTDETAFFLNYSPWKMGQLFSYVISHLHFVTLTGLSALLDRLGNGHYVSKIFPAELQNHEETELHD
jgi:hypothetical protein